MEIPANEIGRGSYSKVYRYENENGEVFALKVFNEKLKKNKIKNLVKQLVDIHHKNVVALCGFFLTPAAILLEYCQVCIDDEIVNNMKDLIEAFHETDYKLCGFEERLSYCNQALEGLIYLHTQNIIHRDVKPLNMLISGPLNAIVVKLCDFGEVYAFKETYIASTLTQEGLKGMTLTYIAPEKIFNKTKGASTDTDAYALGISAFEIFSGLKNAWINNFNCVPVDGMLTEALRHGELPDTTCLYEMYDTRNAQLIEKILAKLWTERNLNEVTIFLLKLIFFIVNMKLSLYYLADKIFAIPVFQFKKSVHLESRRYSIYDGVDIHTENNISLLECVVKTRYVENTNEYSIL